MFQQQSDILDWDGVLENDGSENTILPEGDYAFKVSHFERGTFPGSEKLCPCSKAMLTLEVSGEAGTAIIHDDLILHKKMEWRLSQFFRSIGHKKKGEKIVMDWNAVPGSTGYAHVVVAKYTDKNCYPREINRIDKYLDPEAAETAAQSFIGNNDFSYVDEKLPFQV